jgi:hypothetical protein
MRLLFIAAVLSAALALPAGAADTAQQTGMKGGAKTAATPAPSMAMSGKPMMSGSMNSMKMEAGGQAKCKDARPSPTKSAAAPVRVTAASPAGCKPADLAQKTGSLCKAGPFSL